MLDGKRIGLVALREGKPLQLSLTLAAQKR